MRTLTQERNVFLSLWSGMKISKKSTPMLNAKSFVSLSAWKAENYFKEFKIVKMDLLPNGKLHTLCMKFVSH